MYITKRGKKGAEYVYLVEAKRVDGVVKHETIKKFGLYSKLVEKDPDAYTKLQAQYNVEHEPQASMTAAAFKIIEKGAPSPDVIGRVAPLLNYAPYILNQIWYGELDLPRFCTYLSTKYPQIGFDLNKVISTLVYLKTFAPSSVNEAFTNKACLMGAPLEGVSLAQLYGALGILSEQKNSIMGHVNRKLDAKLSRNYNMVYYDVTNAYFESPLTDEERGLLREKYREERNEILEQAVKDGLIELPPGVKSVDELDELGVMDQTLDGLPLELWSDLRCAMYFKMRGQSKEHRFDLPLISVTLVIDENAIPIDFEIYSGCRSEFKSMYKSIDAMKKKYRIKDAVVVADRGLNSAENLQMLLDKGYGFLVAQKVSNLKEDVRKKILDGEGYTEKVYKRLDRNGEEVITDRVRYKAIKWTKTDTKGNSVKCTLMAYYSDSRYSRDRHDFEKALEKARTAVRENKRPGKKDMASKFIKVSAEVKNAEKESPLTMDDNAVAKAEEMLGYYGIVYRKAPNATTELAADQIGGAYGHLVQIEDCFRVMKSNLGLRPMYVWTENHIRGHVTCCVLALILIRRLQRLSEESFNDLTVDQIQRGLKEALLVSCYFTDRTVYIKPSSGKWLYRGRQNYSEKEMVDFIKNAALLESETDVLLKSVGLTPLPVICDRTVLARSLKTKIGDDRDLIDSVFYNLASGKVHPNLKDYYSEDEVDEKGYFIPHSSRENQPA